MNNHKIFQFFLLTALSFGLSQTIFAAEKRIQTLEEINADLEAKKAELEPFDQKKVKIDIESLGLDDVDKKPAEPAKEASETQALQVEAVEKQEVKQQEEKEVSNPSLSAPTQAVNSEKPKEIVAPKQPRQSANSSKKKDNLKNTNQETSAALQDSATTLETTADDIKKPTEKYINSQKKKNLKKRLEAEKRKKENALKQEYKLKKLEELRAQYLQESEELVIDSSKDDEDFESSEKIVPHKKDLNPFMSEEMPALPILQRYRTKDNLHIPVVLTPRERIDILFKTISMSSVSSFNEAYKDIQNPNALNISGDTILTYSILLKKYPIIASVLAKGADPNRPNRLGYTPTQIAIELLDFKSLELLTNNKADLNYVDGFGRTYLMHAARVGMLSAVDLLISHGAEINAMDDDGFTALAIAYRHKKELVVQYLLKHGAATWIEKPYNPEKGSLIIDLENRWK